MRLPVVLVNASAEVACRIAAVGISVGRGPVLRTD
jgi:hypothetical protein